MRGKFGIYIYSVMITEDLEYLVWILYMNVTHMNICCVLTGTYSTDYMFRLGKDCKSHNNKDSIQSIANTAIPHASLVSEPLLGTFGELAFWLSYLTSIRIIHSIVSVIIPIIRTSYFIQHHGTHWQ
jgi:hypothetical protein